MFDFKDASRDGIYRVLSERRRLFDTYGPREFLEHCDTEGFWTRTKNKAYSNTSRIKCHFLSFIADERVGCLLHPKLLGHDMRDIGYKSKACSQYKHHHSHLASTMRFFNAEYEHLLSDWYSYSIIVEGFQEAYIRLSVKGLDELIGGAATGRLDISEVLFETLHIKEGISPELDSEIQRLRKEMMRKVWFPGRR